MTFTAEFYTTSEGTTYTNTVQSADGVIRLALSYTNNTDYINLIKADGTFTTYTNPTNARWIDVARNKNSNNQYVIYTIVNNITGSTPNVWRCTNEDGTGIGTFTQLPASAFTGLNKVYDRIAVSPDSTKILIWNSGIGGATASGQKPISICEFRYFIY